MSRQVPSDENRHETVPWTSVAVCPAQVIRVFAGLTGRLEVRVDRHGGCFSLTRCQSGEIQSAVIHSAGAELPGGELPCAIRRGLIHHLFI